MRGKSEAAVMYAENGVIPSDKRHYFFPLGGRKGKESEMVRSAGITTATVVLRMRRVCAMYMRRMYTPYKARASLHRSSAASPPGQEGPRAQKDFRLPPVSIAPLSVNTCQALGMP